MECCHYFSKQSEFQSCHSNLLVTLLTGQKEMTSVGDSKKEDFGKGYSPTGVAKNFGEFFCFYLKIRIICVARYSFHGGFCIKTIMLAKIDPRFFFKNTLSLV